MLLFMCSLCVFGDEKLSNNEKSQALAKLHLQLKQELFTTTTSTHINLSWLFLSSLTTLYDKSITQSQSLSLQKRQLDLI